MAATGDVKEIQGLLERGVIALVPEMPKHLRFIPSRMVRRYKGSDIKSRCVLQDVAKTKPSGGESYAATPSLSSLRLLTAFGARLQ